MKFVDSTAEASEVETEEQKVFVRKIGETVVAYIKAAKNLLSGKLSHLKSFAPRYLAEPGKVLAACSSEGVVIRFESAASDAMVGAGWFNENISKLAADFSQNMIHCYLSKEAVPNTPTEGIELELVMTDTPTGITKKLTSYKISIYAILERPTTMLTCSPKTGQ